MTVRLHRYWFEFDIPAGNHWPVGVRLSCGVTAHSSDDARELLRARVFDGDALPAIRSVVEDVDVSTLDAAHVLPNMGDVTRRGIWFPLGFA